MDTERIKSALAALTPAPLHVKLRQAIYEQIIDGSLLPGESLPSERLLQQHFNVSRATIRQAINTLIQEGMLQSVAGTGTFVLSRPPRTANVALIGMIVSSPNFNFFYPQLTAAFSSRIRLAGYQLTLAMHNERTDTIADISEDLLAQNVVALAITPPRLGDFEQLVNRLQQRNVPIVCVGRRVNGVRVDCAATDNLDVGYRATRHLIELGHRDIAHVGLLDYTTGQDRAEGYHRAMNEAGLSPHVIEVGEDLLRPENRSADDAPREHLADPAADMLRAFWAKSDALPTAIFAFNDVMAMGIYKALRDIGVVIPDDVSLISVDDLITIRHFEIPFTTFKLPGEQIGVRAAELLLKRLVNPQLSAELHLLPATLVARASTTPPR